MATPPFLHQPPLQVYPPFLAKSLYPPSQVTQFLEGPTPHFNKGWGGGGVHCSQLNQLILKNLIPEFPKNMIKPPLLWLINFQIMLRLMKSNVPLLNEIHKNFQKATIYVSELILTPFITLDQWWGGKGLPQVGYPLMSFRIFVGYVIITKSIQALYNI